MRNIHKYNYLNIYIWDNSWIHSFLSVIISCARGLRVLSLITNSSVKGSRHLYQWQGFYQSVCYSCPELLRISFWIFEGNTSGLKVLSSTSIYHLTFGGIVWQFNIPNLPGYIEVLYYITVYPPYQVFEVLSNS